MLPRRSYKNVHLEHYRTFCETARRGSLSAAAAALGLSRSTVWQQVDGLERDFGVKLVRRRGRGIELTAEGQELLELVGAPVAALASAKEALLARRQQSDTELRLAVIQGTELDLVIQQFHRQAPGVRLNLIEQRSRVVLQLVQEDGCDLGFALESPGVARSPDVHYERVGERGLTLLTPLKHPLADKRRITVKDLAAYSLITWPRENPLRHSVDSLFERAGLLARMEVAAETDLLNSFEQCVALGLGIGLATWPPGHKPSMPVRVRPLGPNFGVLQLVLLWKKGKYLSPPAATFVELVKKSLQAK